MTFEEALRKAKLHLKKVKSINEFFNITLIKEIIIWLEKVIEALEKQVPQTVKHNHTEVICPRCNRVFEVSREFDCEYCWYCGQELNWYWSDINV